MRTTAAAVIGSFLAVAFGFVAGFLSCHQQLILVFLCLIVSLIVGMAASFLNQDIGSGQPRALSSLPGGGIYHVIHQVEEASPLLALVKEIKSGEILFVCPSSTLPRSFYLEDGKPVKLDLPTSSSPAGETAAPAPAK